MFSILKVFHDIYFFRNIGDVWSFHKFRDKQYKCNWRHTGEKPYKCNWSHTGEKLYKCNGSHTGVINGLKGAV